VCDVDCGEGTVDRADWKGDGEAECEGDGV
jgi:hypothetical protein